MRKLRRGLRAKQTERNSSAAGSRETNIKGKRLRTPARLEGQAKWSQSRRGCGSTPRQSGGDLRFLVLPQLIQASSFRLRWKRACLSLESNPPSPLDRDQFFPGAVTSLMKIKGPSGIPHTEKSFEQRKCQTSVQNHTRTEGAAGEEGGDLDFSVVNLLRFQSATPHPLPEASSESR